MLERTENVVELVKGMMYMVEDIIRALSDTPLEGKVLTIMDNAQGVAQYIMTLQDALDRGALKIVTE